VRNFVSEGAFHAAADSDMAAMSVLAMTFDGRPERTATAEIILAIDRALVRPIRLYCSGQRQRAGLLLRRAGGYAV
jgi:hypothetical protein